jgi:hypothetical protein
MRVLDATFPRLYGEREVVTPGFVYLGIRTWVLGVGATVRADW